MISKILQFRNLFSLDANDPHEGLKIFEKYVSYFHVIASKSVDDYFLRKVLLKRQITCFLLNLNFLITCLRLTIINYFDSELVKMFFADFTFLFVRSDIFVYMVTLFLLAMSIFGNYACLSNYILKIKPYTNKTHITGNSFSLV